MQTQDQISAVAKTTADAFSVGTVIGALVNVLPAVATVFTIVWIGIRIYETETVRRLIRRVRRR